MEHRLSIPYNFTAMDFSEIEIQSDKEIEKEIDDILEDENN